MGSDEFSIFSKNDIPFPEAQLNIHQPTLKQIGLIGQENFFLGCKTLTISKDKIEDDIDLSKITNFDVFMSIVQDKNPASQRSRACAQMLLLLMFPNYKVNFLPGSIGFIDTSGDKPRVLQINAANFDKFREIVKEMFCLKDIFNEQTGYNPATEVEGKLAEKFRKYHEKIAKMKNGEDGQTSSIFSRYISILAVGQKKDINTLLDYSVYQIMNQFRRFIMKQNFDIYVQEKLAGAKDLDEVDNWKGDLNSLNH